MRPAPATNTASLVASSASRGTNQTSLQRVESLTFPSALPWARLGHGTHDRTAASDAGRAIDRGEAARAALRGTRRDREDRVPDAQRARCGAVPHPDVYISRSSASFEAASEATAMCIAQASLM